jgi:predicted ATP-grasp superfamily ATP-dependent carboligase
MRLLVPNARNCQAYEILQSLRPLAERIALLAERRQPLEQYLAHAAFAPEVDRWVPAGWPVADWERGYHPAENTPPEEAYIALIERLCAEERLDWIFPSIEGATYVLAKNRARLASRGVSVVCPALETVRLVNDKFASMDCLAAAGLPAPRTLLPGADGLPAAARQLGFPLVVKPRFSSASRGVTLVRDATALRPVYDAIAARYGEPILQEFVPGELDGAFLRVIGVADGASNVVAVHVARTLLTLFRGSVVPPAVARSESNPDVAGITARAVKALGVTGPFLVQYKVHAGDGAPRILEANCKLSYRIWTARADGLDVPRLALAVARGESVVPREPARYGTVLVNTPELWLARLMSPGRARRVRDAVRRGPVVRDPYTRALARTPRVSALWWITFLGFAHKEQLLRRLRAAARALRRRGHATDQLG